MAAYALEISVEMGYWQVASFCSCTRVDTRLKLIYNCLKPSRYDTAKRI